MLYIMLNVPFPYLLCDLPDFMMLRKIKAKRSFVRRLYEKTIIALCDQYPTLFPIDVYTFESFSFAWDTIQARAFGKRLKWSALVPFAGNPRRLQK